MVSPLVLPSRRILESCRRVDRVRVPFPSPPPRPSPPSLRSSHGNWPSSVKARPAAFSSISQIEGPTQLMVTLPDSRSTIARVRASIDQETGCAAPVAPSRRKSTFMSEFHAPKDDDKSVRRRRATNGVTSFAYGALGGAASERPQNI